MYMDKKNSDTTKTKTNKSQEDHVEEELKDVGFHVSWRTVYEILVAIRSETTPNYDKWDAYATSFYLKTFQLYTSSLNQHEESEEEETTSEEEDVNIRELVLTFSSSEEISSEEEDEDMDLVQYGSSPEAFPVLEDVNETDGFCRPTIMGPYDFGSYTPGEEPKCIPYHLYLLVKEAAHIMNPSKWPTSNPDDLKKLKLVENKIWFFCYHFHSHLPTDWRYSRDTIFTLVENCNPTPQPRYNMEHYTPISTIDRFRFQEYDEVTNLSRKDMINIMSIVHSRQTPAYWKMGKHEVLFYCKLCSCFNIDYVQLDAASADDVSLMYVVRID